MSTLDYEASNNAPGTGSSIFHPKHGVTKVTTSGDKLPPGHPEFHEAPRKIKGKPMPSVFA